ncbi:MAG: PD-(D/E)XK nuclease family protein [Bacteroidales bacterium]
MEKNRYESFTPDQMEEHLSYYLIESWSYSKVSCFARNEKAFEKEYVYCERGRRSSSSVAGNAYHAALKYFFNVLRLRLRGVDDCGPCSLIDLQQVAYEYLEQVPANDWKLQKTTPTVEAAKADALRKVTSALTSFMQESGIYTDGVSEVLGVEERIECWAMVNGVDIPLPCHAEVDLVVRMDDGRVVIIDHKLKSSYSDESEVALVHGKQAVTYAICWETRHPDLKVSEVCFVENKHSKNKDCGPQLRKFTLPMDQDMRRLYEALLYEPLRRMIEAVSNPDYIYTVNDSDSLTDKAELYEFWMRTLVADVDDFNVPQGKRSLIERRQRKIKDSGLSSVDPKVITSFRRNAASFITFDYSMANMTNSERIEHQLRTFSLMVNVAHEISGFSCDTYLLECGAGVKIANIYKYRMDLASALNVPSVRISQTLVEYEGKTYLAVEANKRSSEALPWDASHYLGDMRIPVGMDNCRKVVYWDLGNHSTPHMLVCGATGSGKSVFLRSTIEYAKLAGVNRIIVFDPKFEFAGTLEGCMVISDIKEIEARMKQLVGEMQESAKRGGVGTTLIVFDEFADAVSSARSGKELDIKEKVCTGNYKSGLPKYEIKVVGRENSLEENMKMLLQKGRSLGYRIIAATQRASTKVITGDSKVNFPVQVCFRVPKAIDSNVVIDEDGAESLAGRGDGLMKSPEYLSTVRFQGFFK